MSQQVCIHVSWEEGFFCMNKIFIPNGKGTSSIRGKNLHNKGIQRNPRAAQQKNSARPTHLTHEGLGQQLFFLGGGGGGAEFGGTQLKQQKSNSIDKLTVSKITAEDCQLATPPLELQLQHTAQKPLQNTLCSVVTAQISQQPI